MKKLFAAVGLGILLLGTMAFFPNNIKLGMAEETQSTLKVYARWQASTVPIPNGPVHYALTWRVNGTQVKSDTVAALADTVSFNRAPMGGSDVVDFTIRSLYTVNGNLSGPSTMSKTFANPDRQFPGVTVIITVDTTTSP